MVVPKQADVGRPVMYHPIGCPPVAGVITGISERRVFVQLGERSYNLAVSPADLQFLEASKQAERRSIGFDHGQPSDRYACTAPAALPPA
jgi:hypothetical protein